MKKLNLQRVAVKYIAVITIIAALISAWSISCFASYDYEVGDESIDAALVS